MCTNFFIHTYIFLYYTWYFENRKLLGVQINFAFIFAHQNFFCMIIAIDVKVVHPW